ncbi:MAG: alkylhydroperoxidase [Devosia nanyangense]|nr:alkylhydroperoxidase [Devosia nanyangense]
MFLKTIAPEEAEGEIAEIYRHELDKYGFVMDASRCMTTRPDLMPLVEHFIAALRDNFSLGLRGWRLITLIAAKEIPSTYCSHVYSKALAAEFGKDKVMAIQRDFRTAGLDAKDVAMLAYAQKVARNASEVNEADIADLRAVGFTDHEICDIALCASFRCFLSRLFDSLGAQTEPFFVDDDEGFRKAMTVGRPLREMA